MSRLRQWTARLRNRWAAFVHDLAMVPAAWLGAYWLRYNLDAIPPDLLRTGLGALAVVVPVQAAAYWWFGLYRGVWRFASIPDLMRILRAVVVGVALSMLALFAVTRLGGVPRSVPVLYGLLLFAGLSGPRFLYRWWKDHRAGIVRGGERVLIVGAGRAGEMLVRDLVRDPQRRYEPVGFVDDDPAKRGREIHGVRVLGGVDELPRVAERTAAEAVIVAMPSARARDMRRVVARCEETGLPVRTVPRLEDLMAGRVSVSSLRALTIEDVLGREPVRLDWDAISRGLSGRRVLVTGGGGSIGSELCRQLAGLGPARLVVVDHSEHNLYEIDRELRARFPQLVLSCRLADVTDTAAVERVFARERPEVVFHAAAYKHVPMLEGMPREAARNNVLGTRVVAEAADRHGAERFVLVSTDKAVNPTNVMGASKRVAEMVCTALAARSRTRFVTVRFGNVLGSAGSVVPLFREQIEQGGPVTVTHPEVERYFMTIPEACQLIMQAAVMGEGGEIFVLEMGEPVRIRDLAEQMIRLAGRVPGEDVEIVYTGLRPGEKLREELFHEEEGLAPTSHPKILLARHRAVEPDALDRALAELDAACGRCDEMAVLGVLKALVPELRRPETGRREPGRVVPFPGPK